MKYTAEHPEEDKELETGGASGVLRERELVQEMDVNMPQQEGSSLRSTSSLTTHLRRPLRAGEALQLLQGGQEQPMEGEESAMKS